MAHRFVRSRMSQTATRISVSIMAAALLMAGSIAPEARAQPERPAYRGVDPARPASVNTRGRVRARPGRARVIWVGFKMEGNGQVFVQTTSPVAYQVVPGGQDQVVVDLENTRLLSANDGRALDTSAFPTAISRVDADQRGRTTRLTIKLRSQAGYTVRQEGAFLYLDFQAPAGGALIPPAPASP